MVEFCRTAPVPHRNLLSAPAHNQTIAVRLALPCCFAMRSNRAGRPLEGRREAECVAEDHRGGYCQARVLWGRPPPGCAPLCRLSSRVNMMT